MKLADEGHFLYEGKPSKVQLEGPGGRERREGNENANYGNCERMREGPSNLRDCEHKEFSTARKSPG
jgi:hypothetical protein